MQWYVCKMYHMWLTTLTADWKTKYLHMWERSCENSMMRPLGSHMRLYARRTNAHSPRRAEADWLLKIPSACVRPRGWLRFSWTITLCLLHTHRAVGEREDVMVWFPCALAMVVVLTLLGNFLKREAQWRYVIPFAISSLRFGFVFSREISWRVFYAPRRREYLHPNVN